MIDDKQNDIAFNQYIQDCRTLIANTFFTEEELQKGLIVRADDEKLGIIKRGLSVEEAIVAHRNNLINIKLEHTMRVVEDVIRMAKKMDTPVDFLKVIKVAAKLHDIARFKQATRNFDFNDRKAVNMSGQFHAEHGYNMLIGKNRLDDLNPNSKKYDFGFFGVPEKDQVAIGVAVRHHQDANIPELYNAKFERASQLDTERFLTGDPELKNEPERIIVSTILQMVKDVDMLDILYQHLTGEFPVIRPSIFFELEDKNNLGKKMTLEEVAKHFDVSPKILKEFNKLQSDDISNLDSLNIPTEEVNPASLTVPLDIQMKFFNNEVMDLRELQARQDWTFITGMWWRLNKFLNSITFLPNLELVQEKDLLSKIYNQYPDKYKPLVYRAFVYAESVLVAKTIKDNKDGIYIRR